MKILTTLIVAAVLVAIGGIGFAYSGLYDVSASSPHSGVVNWLLSTTSHASIERYAQDVQVPDLGADDLARAGVNDFDAMCADCHGAPGQAPAAMGQGLNPPAPDLTESAAHMTLAELFWVTKHGIKMTGMPAWGATHDDAAIWPVVAFMTRLPDMDADAYQAFRQSAVGMGHHADGGGAGDDHDHGPGSDNHDESASGNTHDHAHSDGAAADSHDHGEPSQEPETPQSDHDHDGHDHEH